ncbi:hypothetical protein [Streptomyces sp. CHB9.2]|uniref:hypothetical protein n=1 Tax=Streptomyces sp. CHB9.2 TaxID=2841670 RepID=UPI002095B5D1|nr:hypothetical protein [Streptomyces sp. CHB9.2]MCO6704697.1 hypothetical protein [Streptomyces sp. CHB9.2]
MTVRVSLESDRGTQHMSMSTLEEFEVDFFEDGEDLVSRDEADRVFARSHFSLLQHLPGWRATVDAVGASEGVEQYYVLTDELAMLATIRTGRLAGAESLIMRRNYPAAELRKFICPEPMPVLDNFFEKYKDHTFQLVFFDFEWVEWVVKVGNVTASVMLEYDNDDYSYPVKIKIDRFESGRED